MKTAVHVVVAFALLATGCAMSPSGAARTLPPDPPALAGTWSGTLTGPDMASAAGVMEAQARLTIAADGRWTLTSSGGAVATGTSRRVADKLVLDGTMTAGDPMGVGRAISFALEPRGPNALYGDGQTFFLGHRIDAGISLGRVS